MCSNGIQDRDRELRPYPKYVFYFSEKYRKLAKGSVHLHNGMLYDFGIDPEYFGNESALNELINQVDRNFDLIMIVERFDDSLILLKNGLRWNDEDMSSLKLNVHENATKSILSEKAKDSLRKWLQDSYKFYDFFQVIYGLLLSNSNYF